MKQSKENSGQILSFAGSKKKKRRM